MCRGKVQLVSKGEHVCWETVRTLPCCGGGEEGMGWDIEGGRLS